MNEVIAFPTPKSKVLFDYRSGVTVLSCDSPYDVAEPYASELEALMLAGRPIGFTYAWRHPDLSEPLRRELKRIRLPMWEIGDVVMMARDFRVIGELPPSPSASALIEVRDAA